MANQEYLGNRQSSFTKATLTDVFRVLKNIDSIDFLGFEATYHLSVYPFVKQVLEPFNCSIQPYKGYWLDDERRRVVAAPVGDALFEIGIESLAQSEVYVQSLKINCAMAGYFGWENITGWEKLGLSRLQTLEFDPWITSELSWGDERKPSNYEDDIALRASDAITEIMKKCKNSLEIFTYGTYSPMIWPGAQVISLPNLKTLSLENGYLELKNTQRVCIL